MIVFTTKLFLITLHIKFLQHGKCSNEENNAECFDIFMA